MGATRKRAKRYRTNKQDLEWSEEQAASHESGQNIGEIQRLVSALAGAGLLMSGLTRRSLAGGVMALGGVGLLYRAAGGYCPAFDALGIDMEHGASDTSQLGRRKVQTGRATKIRQSIEINRAPKELYKFWRALENLPRVMSHLQSVHVINDRLSHWVVKTMAGFPAAEWDAEIINDVENERIGWRSLHDSVVDNTGSVEFEPLANGRRTKLTITLQYAPPAGRLGAALAKLLGEDPDDMIAEDLRRFRETMETGVDAGAKNW